MKLLPLSRRICSIACLMESVFGLPISQIQHVVNASQGGPILRFASDGTFQISVFHDLHYGEGEDNRKDFEARNASRLTES
jgi:hypothetical protein